MTEQKLCKVCNFTRQKSYGLVVSSLDQLKIKGCEFLGFSPDVPLSVVLEDDGTVVQDEAYFLCLPSNTKFMLLHEKEKWSQIRRPAIDGGTAWMTRESVVLGTDAVDCSIGTEPWWILAQQLKQDLASIILMSEADLQTLVDIPCPQLASALDFQEKRVEDLQKTLQRVLDRREEERQSKELLQLYLKAVEREYRQEVEPSLEGAGDMDVPDGMEVDSASGFMTRTLMVLKGKTSPETRLSTEELQMVVTKGVATMEQVLGWDGERTSGLLQACEAELTRRLQQVQAMRSLSSHTQPDSNQQSNEKSAEDSQDTPAESSK